MKTLESHASDGTSVQKTRAVSVVPQLLRRRRVGTGTSVWHRRCFVRGNGRSP